jgi:hypothetical protein
VNVVDSLARRVIKQTGGRGRYLKASASFLKLCRLKCESAKIAGSVELEVGLHGWWFGAWMNGSNLGRKPETQFLGPRGCKGSEERGRAEVGMTTKGGLTTKSRAVWAWIDNDFNSQTPLRFRSRSFLQPGNWETASVAVRSVTVFNSSLFESRSHTLPSFLPTISNNEDKGAREVQSIYSSCIVRGGY